MVSEIIIKIEDDDGLKLNKKNLVYDEFSVSLEDPLLKQIVEDARSKVKINGEPEININIKLEWK